MLEIKTKLNAEASEPYTKNIAEYLIKAAEENEDLRSMILDQGKTLGKCFLYIRDKAKKLAKKGCACVRDNTVYGWAVEYYGLESAEINNIEIEENCEYEETKESIKAVKISDCGSIAKKDKSEKHDDLTGQIDIFSFLG